MPETRPGSAAADLHIERLCSPGERLALGVPGMQVHDRHHRTSQGRSGVDARSLHLFAARPGKRTRPENGFYRTEARFCTVKEHLGVIVPLSRGCGRPGAYASAGEKAFVAGVRIPGRPACVGGTRSRSAAVVIISRSVTRSTYPYAILPDGCSGSHRSPATRPDTHTGRHQNSSVTRPGGLRHPRHHRPRDRHFMHNRTYASLTRMPPPPL
jgi:hypothetical protein